MTLERRLKKEITILAVFAEIVFLRSRIYFWKSITLFQFQKVERQKQVTCRRFAGGVIAESLINDATAKAYKRVKATRDRWWDSPGLLLYEAIKKAFL